MEHLLVLTTVERIGDSLPSTPSSQRRKGFNLKGYIKTLNELIVLPNIDLHKVVQPLVDLYDNVSKVCFYIHGFSHFRFFEIFISSSSRTKSHHYDE